MYVDYENVLQMDSARNVFLEYSNWNEHRAYWAIVSFGSGTVVEIGGIVFNRKCTQFGWIISVLHV